MSDIIAPSAARVSEQTDPAASLGRRSGAGHARRHVRRIVIGCLVLVHGLAHAGAGVLMAPAEPSFVFTLLWSFATVGFLAAGFGLLHVRGLAVRWRFASVVATLASMVLLLVYTPFALLPGLVADALILVLVLGADPHGGAAAAMTFDPHRPPRHRVWARVAQVVVIAFLVYVGAVTLLRPWFLTWGTTREERVARRSGGQMIADTPTLRALVAASFGALVFEPAHFIVARAEGR